ncbi:MAG: hypothetical protein LBU77_05470 [Clostridiales bacterium]|jgi:hypothetical protein|nr:hypothetical protein [Clostridiales bacterium]
MPYIEKRIYSGRYLEVMRYYLPDQRRPPNRAPRENPIRKEQEELNNRNSVKNLARRMQANFTEDDLFVTLTYKNKKISEDEAKKQRRNFIKRAQDFCRKSGRPEFKYIIVTETTEKRKGIHHHMVCNSLTMDEVQAIWGQGRTTSSNLEFDVNGLMGLATYLTKEKHDKNEKRWSGSKNLTEPVIETKTLGKPPSKNAPKPLKGYRVVEAQLYDNFFTGRSQYITMVQIEGG